MGGAVLINKSTGQPEWVSSDKLNASINAGTHYSRTGKVNITTPGNDKARATSVTNLNRMETEHGAEAVSDTAQYNAKRLADRKASYDNGLDKFLAFTEGAASTLTYGAADILMDDEATRMRADVNSGWRSAGEVTGIVAPALATMGGSLVAKGAIEGGKAVTKGLLRKTVEGVIKATPAGIGANLATKAGLKAGARFAEGTLARKATALAVEGAVESAMWSTGQQLSQAVIEDKDLAAESMLANLAMDTALGGAVGAGFAGIGHGITTVKGKLDTRAMKHANPLFDLDSEVSKGFRGAIVGSADDAMKYDKYFKEKFAALDVLDHRGFSDKAAIKLRHEAYAAYDASKAKYKRFLGFKDELVTPEAQEVALRRFMEKSSKRDIIKFVKVLDDFHVKTSELDNLLKPSGPGADLAKFRKDIDVTAIDPKPMVGTQVVNEGQIVEEISTGPIDAQKTGNIHGAKGKPKPKLAEGPALAAFDAADVVDFDSPGYRNQGNKISNDILEAANAKAMTKPPGFSSKRFDERMFELGKELKGDGSKINVIDALAVGEAMGIDVDKVPVVGPVAASVLNMWLFYRMGGVLSGGFNGAAKGYARGGLKGAAKNAMAQGIARMGADVGRRKAGAFGAGVAYSAAYAGSRAAMDGVGHIGSKTGETSSKIRDAVKAVLTPNVKQAVKRSIVPYSISNASYATPIDSDPKDDYGRIEAQLSRSATDDLAMQGFLNNAFEDFRILDAPMTDAMITAKQKQFKHLYSKLPKRPIGYPQGMPWAPPPSDMIAFKQTAAIFHDPMSVVTRLQAGTLTKQAVEDLATMWPTIYNNLVEGVMDEMHSDSAFAKLNPTQQRMIAVLTQQPLTVDTDPHIIAFNQEQWMKERKQTESQGAAVAGANSVKAGTATPGQQYGMGPRR